MLVTSSMARPVVARKGEFKFEVAINKALARKKMLEDRRVMQLRKIAKALDEVAQSELEAMQSVPKPDDAKADTSIAVEFIEPPPGTKNFTS